MMLNNILRVVFYISFCLKMRKSCCALIMLLFFVWIFCYGDNYSSELQSAYDWAYQNWVTTQDSIEKANMKWKITRAEMAKMMVWFSVNVMGNELPTWVLCSFDDVKGINPSLEKAVIQSCELWIMWQWIKAFRPNDFVTRAEFWTVLSRALWWNKNEWWEKYYQNHLKALKSEWIMNNISSPMGSEIRGYVMLMLMRTANKDFFDDVSENDNQIADVIKMLD